MISTHQIAPPSCPHCGGHKWYWGPSGGASVNLLCLDPDCRHWINWTAASSRVDDLDRVEPIEVFQAFEGGMFQVREGRPHIAEVVSLDAGAYRDIPRQLRGLADEIERGEHAGLRFIIAVLASGNSKCEVRGWGEYTIWEGFGVLARALSHPG